MHGGRHLRFPLALPETESDAEATISALNRAGAEAVLTARTVMPQYRVVGLRNGRLVLREQTTPTG